MYESRWFCFILLRPFVQTQNNFYNFSKIKRQQNKRRQQKKKSENNCCFALKGPEKKQKRKKKRFRFCFWIVYLLLLLRITFLPTTSALNIIMNSSKNIFIIFYNCYVFFWGFFSLFLASEILCMHFPNLKHNMFLVPN